VTYLKSPILILDGIWILSCSDLTSLEFWLGMITKHLVALCNLLVDYGDFCITHTMISKSVRTPICVLNAVSVPFGCAEDR